MYEVERPLSINLKGAYHTSCPYGYVGRGRVRVVTHGLNLPRHGTEEAREVRVIGVLAKTAGRSIKRMNNGVKA
ncbi:MAG: hypothetical protein JRJ41_13530 [Deltaproteobacteria bacterium]|nr:hypothetical protein [Deltaproteobacteria bacterium]